MYNIANKANLLYSLFLIYIYVYIYIYINPYIFRATMCSSSGENCVHATVGTCYSVWMTVWYDEWNVSFHPAYQTIIYTE